MALARVITSSDTCARELTSALIDYGYTVEVVSPESAPPHAADLELRVDSSPDEKLVASVRTSVRNHSASLNFVHQLKAASKRSVFELPVFVSGPTVCMSDSAVSISEPGLRVTNPFPDVLAAQSPVQPEPANLALQSPAVSSVPPLLKVEADERRSEYCSSEDIRYEGARFEVGRGERERCGPHRSGNGLGACALTLAAVVLPAVLLVLGLRPREISAKPLTTTLRLGSVPSLDPKTSVEQRSANMVAVSPRAMPAPNLSADLLAPKPESIVPTSHANVRTHARAQASKPRSESARKADEIVARDTVTYLDERYRPTAKLDVHKKRVHAHHRAISGHIAANTTRKSKQTSN